MCENNWVRKIARVTRADKRRMVELREETGVQRSLTERLVRSRLQWAGHVESMADDRLPKRAAELREQGRRRRGGPRLRWEDCVNTYSATYTHMCKACSATVSARDSSIQC